jgi:hypothetical protein
VAYLLPYTGTDEGSRIILSPNIEDPVAGDAAEGAAVVGDAAQAAAVAGAAAEGVAFPANPDEDVDEDVDQVVVKLPSSWHPIPTIMAILIYFGFRLMVIDTTMLLHSLKMGYG